MKVKTNRTLFEIATEYYFLLQEPDVTTEEIQQWQEWLAESKENGQAFKEVENLMCLTSSIDDVKWPHERELIEDDYDGSVSVEKWLSRKNNVFYQLKGKLSSLEFRQLNFKPAYICLGFLAILLLMFDRVDYGLNLIHKNEVIYQSNIGENLPIQLEDHSTITLGADTKIIVRYSKTQRHIVLDYGEAYFDVAKDPSRPFTVNSGNRSVTALGTEFNISRQSIRSVVTVTEGKVIVEPENDKYVSKMTSSVFYKKLKTDTFLEAGQSIAYDQNEISPVESVDVKAQTSWRNGTLKYINESLGFVIEDINRYSSIPIVVQDNRILEMRYSGTIFVGGIDGWIQSLPHIFPVEINNGKDKFKVDYKPISELSNTLVNAKELQQTTPNSCLVS